MISNTKSGWIIITLVLLGASVAYLFLFTKTPMKNSSFNSPEELGYQRLIDASQFYEGQQREAIQAIIIALENSKEDPKQFYAKFEPDLTASKLTFNLMHENSFKPANINKAGNPSGKDRNAIYDLITKKVDFLFWQ